MGAIGLAGLVLFFIALHTFYNTFQRSPDGDVVVQDFPEHMSKAERAAIIGGRKAIIDDMLGVYDGRLEDKEFLKW